MNVPDMLIIRPFIYTCTYIVNNLCIISYSQKLIREYLKKAGHSCEINCSNIYIRTLIATVFQEYPTRYNISNKINVYEKKGETSGRCVCVQELRKLKSNKRNNHNYNIRPSPRR